MARERHYRTELDNRVSDWLISKGVNPDDIDSSYTIIRDAGVTKINVTFYAGDFMVTPEPTPLLRGNEHGACQRPCSRDCPVA